MEVRKFDYLKFNDKIVKKFSSLVGRFNRFKRFIINENMDLLDLILFFNVRVCVCMVWN